jgi:hypothetical protein
MARYRGESTGGSTLWFIALFALLLVLLWITRGHA